MAEEMEVIYASGDKGNDVRADGNGGRLSRGWYVRRRGAGTLGPYAKKSDANMRAFGTLRAPRS